MNKVIRYLKEHWHFAIGVGAIFTVLVVIVFLLINRSDIKLQRVEINYDFEKTVQKIEMDTIESYPVKHLYLVNIIHNGTFGRFWMNYGIMKSLDNHKKVVYEFPAPERGESNRVVGSYIAYVNYYKANGYTIVKKYNK